jgi:halimadienyl-diphosphate synthase
MSPVRLVPAVDVTAEAADLVAGLVAEPWGQVSPSVYETGRLVALSPGLTGHDRRVDHLLRTQRPDGGWGSPEPGYALVPTLSATDALLATLRPGSLGAQDVAATAGLRVLFRFLRGPGALTRSDLPDLPAIELIVPALVASINRRLDDLRDAPAPGVGWWPGRERLRPPAGMDDARHEAVRRLLASGGDLPQKLLHALEVAGDAARRHPAIRPEATGTIGASPAATAAWLGDPAGTRPGSPARDFLESAVRRHGGPVPCGLPITVFERGWVLSWLARAGVPVAPPAELVKSLAASLGPAGTAAAAGLPKDADTTAGALYALALAGEPQPPDPLRAFETETHFCTWPGEDGVSVSTNAHVLEAFGQYHRVRPGRRHAATIAKVSAWLRSRQRHDGSWHDRWHASPCYATACAALALHAFGGPESAASVDRAVRWALATQRADGSWGHWQGTAEETAYAVQLLLLTRPGSPAHLRAAERGCDHLVRTHPDDPPLWHDKDLYHPIAIVRAATLAALHLAHRHRLGLT